MNNEGVWLDNPDELEKMVTKFCSDLFQEKDVHEEFCLKGRFPKLDESEVEMLRCSIFNEEVKKTIFHMESFKARGEDGFHNVFYQSQWKVVEPSLCSIIKDLFHNPSRVSLCEPVYVTPSILLE